jgi:hypothetical protein
VSYHSKLKLSDGEGWNRERILHLVMHQKPVSTTNAVPQNTLGKSWSVVPFGLEANCSGTFRATIGALHCPERREVHVKPTFPFRHVGVFNG